MRERGLLPTIYSSSSTSSEEEAMESLLHWRGGDGGMAVVKMGHFIGAQNFAGGMLALVKCAREGTLPTKQHDPNAAAVGGIASETGGTEEGNGGGAVENGSGGPDGDENATAGESAAAGNEAAAVEGAKETITKGEENGDKPQAEETPTKALPPPEKVSQYTKEEESMHRETLSHLKNVQVYHLFNYQFPDPIPPDLKVPQSDPAPQDPDVPSNLLDALTTLRRRYEEMIKDEGGKSGSQEQGGGPLSGVSYINDDEWGGHAAAAGNDDAANAAAADNNNGPGLVLDKKKLAAAAGGVAGYDEEADPLNAPDVVRAVVEFKRRLEDQKGEGKKRRVKIITDRMGKKVKELLERGREERRKVMEMQKAQATQQQQHAENGGEKAAAAGVEDTGRRGVSNLPAWMTKGDGADGAVPPAGDQKTTEAAAAHADDAEDGGRKRKFVPSEANRDINARKQKLDVDEGGKTMSEIRASNEAADKQAQAEAREFVVQTTNEGILGEGSKFPSAKEPDALKTYVTTRIVDYLGEEESTLIEFIMKELGKDGGCTTASMLEEMKVVLDEDAEDFVLGLYRKMVE